ncbi:MAG: hypothetical protein COW13_02375 [Candidatus Omnitrophica bacterium CG12_big_fil_rev_8_21_14_0_65_50_5]|nr:MAG: hypothetical protein COW13_02375 [Candidatus Omnitrophica bacterium CG12_big_fil_rev_8_21_14_0_65_50_5]
MNKQITILVLVVILGVGAGLLISSQQERKDVGHRLPYNNGEVKGRMIQSMQELKASVDALTVEIKALKSNVPAAGQAAKAASAAPSAEDYDKVYKIDIGRSSVVGKKNVPVTIVEFMDLQCPYCGRFHPALDELIQKYPDQVNYVIKNYPLPFHPQARPAAKAAFAAGEQGKYIEMVRLILQNQKNLSEDFYQKLAGDLGLNVGKFTKDLKNKDAEWEQRIEEDVALAERVSVRGTPSFYINGKKTRSRTAEQYKQEIETILKK